MGLYERIKEIAAERGYTVKDVENGVGFPHGSLAKMNRHSPSIAKLQQLATFLDVSVSDFLDEKQRPSYYLDDETAKVAQMIHDNQEVKYVFDAIRGAKPEDLKIVVATLEALRRKEHNYGDD